MSEPAWVPLGAAPVTPPSMERIHEIVLAASGPIDFQNIPQTYRHLRLVASLRADVASPACVVRCNNDLVAGNYQGQVISAASAAIAAAAVVQTFIVTGSTSPAGASTSLVMEIPDYRGAFWKGMLVQSWGFSTATAQEEEVNGVWWKNAAAINRLTLALASGNFVAGSYAGLYGLL